MRFPEIGERYARLVVIGAPEKVTVGKTSSWRSLCLCDCGRQKMIRIDHMMAARTESCGCLHRLVTSAVSRRHGESDSRLHIIWMSMRGRCENPNNRAYKWYGSRGIKVCKEWQSYEAFAQWARSHGYTDNLSIERRNNRDGYNPENCTWIPIERQSRNREVCRKLTAFGETKTISDWIDDARCVVSMDALASRLALKWDHERAITEPIHYRGQDHRKPRGR